MNAELMEAYPGCPNAVSCHESRTLSDIWPAIRAKGLSPPQAVSLLREVIQETLEDAKTIRMTNTEVLDHALPEMDHPDFLKYVAAKLGAM